MSYVTPFDPTLYAGEFYVLGKAAMALGRQAQYTLQCESAEQGITRIQPSNELEQLMTMTGDLCSFDPKRFGFFLPRSRCWAKKA